MRPSFGGCYVACSGADTLEKLNLGVKQAQCYTPGQHSLRDSQRIDAIRSPRYSIAAKISPLSGKRYQVTWNKIATKCCLGELK